MFTITFDRELGIVRCTTDGFHSPDDVREHSRLAANVVAEARRETGRLRSLVLKVDSQIQSAESMQAAADTKTSNQPGDKVAIVIPSALGRLQASRYLSVHEKLFDNEKDALLWLQS